MQQRRPISIKQSSSGGSIWEKEATEFWSQMEPKDDGSQQRQKRLLIGILGIVSLLVIGGFWFGFIPGVYSNESIEDKEITMRNNCTTIAVRSRWHQEMCHKVCPNNEFNEACMSGCFYGTLAITKNVCANRSMSMPSTTACEFTVDCAEACVDYATVRPIPAKRNACEGGCNSVVPSSCKRAADVFDRVVKDKLG